MREAKDAASLTRPVTVRRLMPLVVPVELPVSATLSRRASVSVARDAASLTVTTAPMALEEEAMVADTSPVVATTAERPALAMHSREESAREVTDAVTTTERRVLVIPPLVTTVVGTGPVVCASPSRRVSSLQILHKCYECYISAFSLLQFASHAT